MQEMRAAVAHRFGDPLSVESVLLREPAGSEVEVTLGACAICQSDISWMDGHWGGVLPAVFGHEAAGRISAVGEGVVGYAPGDAVLVTLIRACGRCPSCVAGRPVTCAGEARVTGPISLADGRPVVQSMHCGAFAERVVVDTSQLAPLPRDMPADVAALLACGVITGVGAVVNTAGLRAGQTAVVIGAGGVGLNAIQGARIAGAATIIAIDAAAAKLDAALSFGATHVLPAEDDTTRGEIARITDGHMADVVLVTVGSVRAYEDAVELLAVGGSLVMVGMPASGTTARYDPSTMASLGQRLLGSKMGDTVLLRDVPRLVTLYRQGRLELDALISGRWPLEGINEAIAATRGGDSRRNVIVFDTDAAAGATPAGADT